MRKVICDHAGTSEYCTPRWCNHCTPHTAFWGCTAEICGFIKETVCCVEVKDGE